MQRYQHSGVVPFRGAMLTLGLASVMAVIASFVYAYVMRYIPLIVLKVFATLAYALLLGGAVHVGILIGKVRSAWFAAAAALFTLAIGYYVYWGASFWALGGWPAGLWAWHPQMLASFAKLLFEKGSWGFSDGNLVTGWPLVAIWVVEAGAIACLSWVTAMAALSTPFCERCNQWTTDQPNIARFDGKGDEPVWQRIADGDLPALGEVEFAPAEAMQFVRLDFSGCTHCGQSNYMTLKSVTNTVDKKGNVTTKEKTLVEHIILSVEQVEIIRHLAAEAEAMPSADEPAPAADVAPDANPANVPDQTA